MIINDVMAMNIIIIYKSCTLQHSAWRNMAVSSSKQRTVRSNYVYRTVKTCKSLKRDVHEQMCCGYNDSTINTYPSTAFAANRLEIVRRRCKHPTRLHIERFAASITHGHISPGRALQGAELVYNNNIHGHYIINYHSSAVQECLGTE